MDADLVAAREMVEAVEVEQEMGGLAKDVLALGAALVDVEDVSAFEASQSRRVGLGSAHGCVLLISRLRRGKFSFIFKLFFVATYEEIGIWWQLIDFNTFSI